MSDRISIAELRERANPELAGHSRCPRADLLALVEAVEAAHVLIDRTETDLMEIGRRELRLSVLLRRFDFRYDA